MSENNVAVSIKQIGKEMGFAEVAICDAAPITDAATLLEKWLANQFHGTMEWMVRTKYQRTHPTAYFPEARSVIVVALNYYRENESITMPAEYGNISIYARGRDYHKVLRKKLKHFLDEIQKLLPNARGRVCVDSFPLMEKALAVKAGIGWIGKHTNLIIKQKGSYYFLGEILLSEALPADPPFIGEHCGTCNRCQHACPTDALSTAFVLDARKCLSYLTIEHQDNIAEPLQPGLKNWVFGCDICQMVCPWNRFSTTTEETEFRSRFNKSFLMLENLKNLTETEFRCHFSGTPVMRAGYAKFQRNVAIAISNFHESLKKHHKEGTSP
jgi:epoxyqueuosine reductase